MSSNGSNKDGASSGNISNKTRPSIRGGSNDRETSSTMRHSSITTNTNRRISGLLTLSGDSNSSMENPNKSFPTPFKCAGDFCHFVIQEAASLGNEPKSNRRTNIKTYGAANAVGMLFPKEEMHALGDSNVKKLLSSTIVTKKDSLFDTVDLASPQVGPSEAIPGSQGLRLITYRSVALGKKNKKHLDTAQNALDQQLGTDIPSGMEETTGGALSSTNEPYRSHKRKSFMDNTLSKEIQAGYAKKMGEIEGGTANYYRQVRVCENCYAVYCLLDEGRKLMEEEKNVHQALQEDKIRRKSIVKEEWNALVDSKVEEKERLYMRHSNTKKENTHNKQSIDEGVEDGNSNTLNTSVSVPILPLQTTSGTAPNSTAATTTTTTTGGGSGGSGRKEPSNVSLPVILTPKGTNANTNAEESLGSSTSSMNTTTNVTTSSPLVTWKSGGGGASSATSTVNSTAKSNLLRNHETYLGLEGYLQGKNKRIEEKKLEENKLFSEIPTGLLSSKKKHGHNSSQPSILLVESDQNILSMLHDLLMPLHFDLESISNGNEALEAAKEFDFDLVLCERDLGAGGGIGALEFTKLLRQFEVQMNLSASTRKTQKGKTKRAIIICMTSKTAKEDLKLYMEAGMDGCVSKPLNKDSLLSTVHAAMKATGASTATANASSIAATRNTTDHPNPSLAQDPVAAATEALAKAKARRRKRRMEAATTMALPGLLQHEENVYQGTFQLDADTAIPFCVIGKSPGLNGAIPGPGTAGSTGPTSRNPTTFFNLVIVHDLFDTFERLQILLQPIVARYYGVQVLVWNYPGQAYTEWRKGVTLNNEYLATCLSSLLDHVGPNHLRVFRDAPYYLMGIGNGGNIATAFCAHSPPLDKNTRALILVNSFCYVDAQLAQFFHDSIKVFASTPESRPDLPIYFHTRFIFSGNYLARVTTPLALNLYTAVQNPITLEGRKALCQGALFHVDLRNSLQQIKVPIINLCSSQNGLIKAAVHAQCIVNACEGREMDSICKVLNSGWRSSTPSTLDRRSAGGSSPPKKRTGAALCHAPRRGTCVVWFNSGHEVVQECKQAFCMLVEQFVTGFHEANDVPHTSQSATLSSGPISAGMSSASTLTLGSATCNSNNSTSKQVMRQKLLISSSSNTTNGGGISSPNGKTFEDKFIDKVLSTVKEVQHDVTRGTMVNDTMVMHATLHTNHPTTNSSGLLPAVPTGLVKGPTHGHHGSSNNQTSPDKQHQLQKQLQQQQMTSKNWVEFQQNAEKTAASNASYAAAAKTQSISPAGKKKSGSKNLDNTNSTMKLLSMDPLMPSFERATNLIYKPGEGSKIYPKPEEMPEVKEYMGWRVKRNKKRLQRMENNAKIIQRALRAFLTRTLARRLREQRCAILLQKIWRARLARRKYHGIKNQDWAVRLIQRQWRGKVSRVAFKHLRHRRQSAIQIQRIMRGRLARLNVEKRKQFMHVSAVLIQKLFRLNRARKIAFRKRREKNAAITIQRIYRGHCGRKRYLAEKDRFLFSKTQAQGIEFGKQMLLEYKLYGTRLQSEVAVLTKEKTQAEEETEVLLKEISEFEEGVKLLEHEMHELSKMETEVLGALDEKAKWQLREQKMRLDREFSLMLGKIANRKEKMAALEDKLQALDRERLIKEEDLRGLERKLIVLLEEQQRELQHIKQKQNKRNDALLMLQIPAGIDNKATTTSSIGKPGIGGGGSGGGSGPRGGGSVTGPAAAISPQQREEANSLMQSTETMMKFGFMSMSMTYFSSMNMIRAMRKIGAHHMTLDSAAAVSGKQWPEHSVVGAIALPGMGLPGMGGMGDMPGGMGLPGSASNSPIPYKPDTFTPGIPAGSFPGQQPLQVATWSIADVGRWLDTLALTQYKRAFSDAAVDGALLLHLNDDDLKNTLGMEHRLHRKKVLTSVEQLKESESRKMKKLYAAERRTSTGVDDLAPISSPVISRDGGGGDLSGTSAPGAGSRTTISSSPVRKQAIADSSNPSAAALAAVGSVSLDSGDMKVLLSFPELCTLVRHGKLKQLKEALGSAPERRFDPLTVENQYVPNVGTIYDDFTEKSAFHINNADDNGNTLLIFAAQNNNLKVSQYLISKGANPNHQNKHGQTAGHYAMSYSFFDLGAWLLDPEKGGGRDDLLNENGLTPYDGLS